VSALLEVRDLRVRFATDLGVLGAVDGVSFGVERGRVLGIVGESGSGKTVTGLTIMGLTRGTASEISGEVRFEDRDLLALRPDEMRRVRGDDIAMVFQDPLSSLHPYYRVGRQVAEAVRAHRDVSKATARDRAVELLDLVGLPEPRRQVDAYPHQLSGGMRQRVMIAMALANEPKLLIADEPTTALDVTVQAQILALLARLRAELHMAVIVITHDLGVVAETADDVAVMYAGRIVEHAPVARLFSAPEHPYTWGLLRSMPRLEAPRERELVPIPGTPPNLVHPPGGCRFHPRCAYARPRHSEVDPALEPVPGDAGHEVACLLDPATRAKLRPEEARA
jgi:peptide/nickel transport system ATP-binding protein